MPIFSEISPSSPGKLIAMLVDHVSDPFFANLARRIDRRARSLGYKLVFGSTENDTGFLPKLISVFNNMNVAGYIIAPPAGVDPNVRKSIRGGNPVVLLDHLSVDPGPYSVIVDNFRGACDAVGHLVGTGRRQIAFVTTGSGHQRFLERRRGYKASMENNGLHPLVADLSPGASMEEVKMAIRGLLKKASDLDGLIFADSSLGFSVLAALRQYKKRIPDDIAVIGFDDNDNSQLFVPAITTVVQPVDEIVESVFRCIGGHHPEKNTASEPAPIILPNRLIIRSSTLKTKAVSTLAVPGNR